MLKETGFSYLEVILALIILGVVLIPLLSQFYTGFRGTQTAECVTQAVDLANDLMEEIKSRRFDENIYPGGPVTPAALGIDTGENANDRTTFDDVDDYHNWQKSPPEAIDGTVLSDFARFNRRVTVEYVTLSGADWVISGIMTYYKKITVTVSHPKISDKILVTIVSHH
ncbi:MAG: hypothetical protein ABH952_09005 [Candidatus Omnitrophota bacterium]